MVMAKACERVLKRPRSGRTGGLDHRTIAKLLGMSHGTVQNIERRALEKMRRAAEANGLNLADWLGTR